MKFAPKGPHLIAGERLQSPKRFESWPAKNPAWKYFVATSADVDAAVQSAEDAF